MNPPQVPGILLSNQKIARESPSILDIGPTVLDLFGVPVPAHCDGSSLMPAAAKEESGTESSEAAA
jgi:arylsulfatase A-like enzyme